MINLALINLGKRFNHHWIFRNISIEIPAGKKLLITGNNGSGKSTLLQTLSGFQNASEGHTEIKLNNQLVEAAKFYQCFSFAAPYSELPELLTPKEIIDFQSKILHKSLTVKKKEFLEKTFLNKQANKPIKYFSSGMKQRLKLGLAFFSKSPILLLDEPTSNLDEIGINWYQELLNGNETMDKITIVATNQIASDIPDYDYSIDLEK
jgi:ABC-type multidrug transport system ATPase subunit